MCLLGVSRNADDSAELSRVFAGITNEKTQPLQAVDAVTVPNVEHNPSLQCGRTCQRIGDIVEFQQVDIDAYCRAAIDTFCAGSLNLTVCAYNNQI
jgi:hypothetical protein